MKKSIRLAVLLMGVMPVWSELLAEDSSFFRADRGVTARDDRPLPDRFDSADVLMWRQPLAPGHSTPCVHGDAIYLSTFDRDRLHTVSLDRATGKIRWSQTVQTDRSEPYHSTGSPASPTPACDGKRVYSFFGSYGLLCYDLQGKLLWSKPMGPFQDEFGSASSPVLVDGKLLINQDHDLNNFLLCVDSATGKTLWQTPREGFTRSYSTPIVWDGVSAGKRGKKLVIVAGALRLTGYDLETGKQLWSVDGLARIVNTTPVVAGGLLVVATWSPGGDSDARITMEPWEVAVKQWDKNADGKLTREEANNKEVLDRFYRIDLNQDQGIDRDEWGKYARVFELARNSVMALRLSDTAGEASGPAAAATPQLLWKYERGIPYVSSPLVYRDTIFVVKDGGIVTSLTPDTGRMIKQARVAGTGSYYSSPVAGDGKVFIVSERGVLSVLQAAGDWEVISSHDFGERTVATPVISDGKIYVRTEQALYCFAIRSKDKQ